MVTDLQYDALLSHYSRDKAVERSWSQPDETSAYLVQRELAIWLFENKAVTGDAFRMKLLGFSTRFLDVLRESINSLRDREGEFG